MAVAIADSISAGTASSPLAAIAWPLGAPNNGDNLVAVGITSGTGVITPPAGWTALFNVAAGASTNYQGAALCWKVAASEPASLTWGTTSGAASNMAISMLRITGAVATAPQWVQTTAAASPLTAGPLTPAVLNALVLALFTAASTTTGYSVAGGWNQVTTQAGGWGTFVEAQTALTSSTSTPISVSSTVSGAPFGIDGFLVIVAPALAGGATAIGNTDNPGGAIGNGGVAGGTIGNSLPSLP